MQTFSSKRSRLNWNDADNIVQTVNFQLKQTLKFKLETQTFKQTLKFKLYRCLNLKVSPLQVRGGRKIGGGTF